MTKESIGRMQKFESKRDESSLKTNDPLTRGAGCPGVKRTYVGARMDSIDY